MCVIFVRRYSQGVSLVRRRSHSQGVSLIQKILTAECYFEIILARWEFCSGEEGTHNVSFVQKEKILTMSFIWKKIPTSLGFCFQLTHKV